MSERTLYLAVAKLWTTPYMAETQYSTVQCLVWGIDYDDAERKVRAELTVDDPYGTSTYVADLDLNAAIGEATDAHPTD